MKDFKTFLAENEGGKIAQLKMAMKELHLTDIKLKLGPHSNDELVDTAAKIFNVNIDNPREIHTVSAALQGIKDHGGKVAKSNSFYYYVTQMQKHAGGKFMPSLIGGFSKGLMQVAAYSHEVVEYSTALLGVYEVITRMHEMAKGSPDAYMKSIAAANLRTFGVSV